MKRTEISALYAGCAQLDGTSVTVCGWVKTIRDSKALGFIELNDGSCFKGVQIVFEESNLSTVSYTHLIVIAVVNLIMNTRGRKPKVKSCETCGGCTACSGQEGGAD